VDTSGDQEESYLNLIHALKAQSHVDGVKDGDIIVNGDNKTANGVMNL
jgi:hypothetical protein